MGEKLKFILARMLVTCSEQKHLTHILEEIKSLSAILSELLKYGWMTTRKNFIEECLLP